MSISASSLSSWRVAMTGKRPMNSGIRPNLSRSSGWTCQELTELEILLALDVGAEAECRWPTRRWMIWSRPTKAPPQMKRMLVVSTWRKSCCGCLRPPLGGTLATVPSMILSRACCTPSPDTSRVIGVVALAADLVDLVDVDDAPLGALDVVVGVLQELDDDVLHVLAHVAGLGQRRGVGDGEGDVEQLGQRLREQRLAEPVGPMSRMFDFGQLDIVARRPSGLDALVVVVHRHRRGLLGAVLADHVLVEDRLDLRRAWGLGCPPRRSSSFSPPRR
jgi:hypothetical protein